MKTFLKTGGALIAIAISSLASAATAQRASPPSSTLMVAPPTPDADALAAQMRILATDPKNLAALTKAGELTLKLGDPTAAAVLFSRAEEIAPNDGRLKGDEAAVLVHMERPGEALRLFQQAERMGADPAGYAAERGLAYDLIGQQERAQRDYRTALKANPTDAETMRRYALSLGISGKRDQALAEIDPLVRQQDHAGWRDRAFILAMTGDVDQAEKIAKGMLPPDMASGLSPFFRRLPQLSAVDRAFAVHFGEVAVTPERIADARLIPPLPALAPEAEAQPTQLAATAAPVESARDRKRREKEERRLAKLQKQQQSSKPAGTALAAADTKNGTGRTANAAPIPVTVQDVPPATPTPTPATQTAQQPTREPARRPEVSQEMAPRSAASAPTAVVATQTQPSDTSTRPIQRENAPVAAAKPATRVGQEDLILKNIMAGISVPPSELGETPSPAANVGTPTAAGQIAASTAPDAAVEAKRLEAANLAALKKAADEKAAAEAERKAAADKKAAAAKKAADEKAAAAKKAADEKAKAEKAAAAKKAKADPSRIWVQVAGGANEHDLPKAWAAVKAKAPAAFKGKQGWSTPLNATNRVLTGPFKSDDAAQDFVNTLKKEGLSAFLFTSTAGQKVDKLPAK